MPEAAQWWPIWWPPSLSGRATAQAVSHRPPTATAPVPSQIIRDVWWTSRSWGQFLSKYFRFPYHFTFHTQPVIVVTRKTAICWDVALLRKFCQIASGFHFFVFSGSIFLQSKVSSLAFNPKPGGQCLCIYVPQERGGPVIHPGTGFPFPRLLRLAGLQWRYRNPPPHVPDSAYHQRYIVSVLGASQSQFEVLNAFALSNTGIVGSNPTQGIDIYLRLFCVCVVLCR
jgi:hypothetical protein